MSHAINTAIRNAWKNEQKGYIGKGEIIEHHLNAMYVMSKAVSDDDSQPIGVRCTMRAVMAELDGINRANAYVYSKHILWAVQCIERERWHINGLDDVRFTMIGRNLLHVAQLVRGKN